MSHFNTAATTKPSLVFGAGFVQPLTVRPTRHKSMSLAVAVVLLQNSRSNLILLRGEVSMGSRVCPGCHKKVPIISLLLAGSAFACPRCQAELESDSAPKQVSVWAGLIAGFLAWRAIDAPAGTFGWLLPVLIPFAVFSVVTPLTLALVGGVRLAKSSQPTENKSH